jgi:hypothetical protein
MMAVLAPGFIASGQALRLVGPGYADRLQHSRAGAALVQASSGGFETASQDTPRFQGAARRLLVEEARSNFLRNPLGEGATPGSGSARLPEYWQIDGTVPGITVLATGVEDGLPFVEVRFTGSSTFAIRFDAANPLTAISGQSYASSFFLRLTGGSLSNLLIQNNFITGGSAQSSLAVTPVDQPLGRQRTTWIWTHSGSAISLVNRLRFQAGGSFDVTLRIAAPQLEIGATATSPILPPAGTMAMTTRAADQPFWGHPLAFNAAGTLLLQAQLPQAAPAGLEQGLLQLDDGTDQNRLVLCNAAGGSSIQGFPVIGGAALAALSAGDMVPGQAFRIALAWSPAGLALCLNGAAVQSTSSSMPAALNRLLVGHASAALNKAANGEIAELHLSAARLPDSHLRAMTAAA